MFGRVYTAPPQEIFFDMYENDASFDEAAKNLYDQELEQGFDTASLDEFLEPSIEDFDDAAVEKAIYQTAIAQEQGRNPTEITTTPYGAGLLQDEYDEVINIYPGIGAGMEWRTMDDHYHDAEEMLNDPRAGTSISNLIDVAVEKAEDEGAIDSLGDIFKAFGEQLGRAGQSAAEAHVDSRTELDTDTGDLFLGPSVGPNPPWEVLDAVANTANNIVGVFGDGGGRAPAMDMGGPSPDADPVAQLMEIFEKILVGQATNQKILRDVHLAFSVSTDHDLFAEAIRAWINTGDWNDKVENTGAEPRAIFSELSSVFSLGADTPYDTSSWSGDLKDDDGIKIQFPWEDVPEEDMRARHTRSLSKAFYETIYAQPWGGRAEFASILPSMLSETKTLFLLNAFTTVQPSVSLPPEWAQAEKETLYGEVSEGATVADRLTKRYGESPGPGNTGAASPVGDAYKLFLNNYLQNPSVYRTGPELAKHVERINELLQKRLRYAGQLTEREDPEGTWTDTDIADWAWIGPMFWGTSSEAKTNRYNLITMVAAQGRQGYWANIIKAGTSDAIKHYENMGLAGSEILSLMTRVFGRTGGRATSSDPSQAGGSLNVRPTTKRERFVPRVADPFLEDMDGEKELVDDQETSATGGGKPRYRPVIPKSRPATYRDLSEIGLDPRVSSIEEPTDLDRDIDRILTRGSVSSPGNALIQNRMQFHGETPSEAVAWVNENMPNFPDQPGAEFIEGDYAQFGVDPSLSRSDIGDILTDFDLGAETRVLPPSRMMGPPDASDPTLLPLSMSRDDIADILADFDMGVEMSIPPSRRMGPSQYPGEFVM
jgi:hypothetical protein